MTIPKSLKHPRFGIFKLGSLYGKHTMGQTQNHSNNLS